MWGTRDNIPARLSDHGKKTDIIYWSSPKQEEAVALAMCCETAGPLFVLPCFWPHLLILSPFLCGIACCSKHQALRTDVVLRPSCLELIEANGTVTSFALENIKSVTATTKSQNPCAPTCCIPDINRIIIDDGRTTHTKNGVRAVLTTLWAHENIEEFCRLILEAKERRSQTGTVAAAQMMMQQMGIMQQQMMAQLAMQGQQPMMMGQQPMMMGQQPMMMGQQPMMMGQQPVMGQQPMMAYPAASNNMALEVEGPYANEYPKRYS
jgi:hypothetical protein